LARLGAGVLAALPESVRQNLPGWRAVVGWDQIVSREVASRSQAVAFHSGCLTVHVVSSVWMHHLLALKRQLMADLNAATSGTAPGSAATSPIRDIHFVLNPGLTGPAASRPQGAEG
jgi:hypothetical protein